MSDTVCFRNIGQLIQIQTEGEQPSLKILDRHALIVKNGRVQEVVKDSRLTFSNYSQVIDLKGKAVIPGFVDCHTHLIYAGEQKSEMECRLAGPSCLDTLKGEGGILSTVNATRDADAKSLLKTAKARMKRMLALGTTAFEIKSGYGLDLNTEKKILSVGSRLRQELFVPVTLTYLGAHAVPEGSTRSQYFDFIMERLPLFTEKKYPDSEHQKLLESDKYSRSYDFLKFLQNVHTL